MEKFNFHRSLFMTEDFIPLRFSIRPCGDKKRIREMIEFGGGSVLNLTGLHKDHILKLAPPDSYVMGEEETFSLKYIEDCCEENHLLDIKAYRLNKISRYDDYSPMDVLIGLKKWCDIPLKRDKKQLDEDAGVSSRDSSDSDDEVVHPSHGRRWEPYSYKERIAIVKFLKGRKAFPVVKGREIWQKMEKNFSSSGNYNVRRTWQSMKEHFLKQILPVIDSYDFLTTEEKEICHTIRGHVDPEKFTVCETRTASPKKTEDLPAAPVTGGGDISSEKEQEIREQSVTEAECSEERFDNFTILSANPECNNVGNPEENISNEIHEDEGDSIADTVSNHHGNFEDKSGTNNYNIVVNLAFEKKDGSDAIEDEDLLPYISLPPLSVCIRKAKREFPNLKVTGIGEYNGRKVFHKKRKVRKISDSEACDSSSSESPPEKFKERKAWNQEETEDKDLQVPGCSHTSSKANPERKNKAAKESGLPWNPRKTNRRGYRKNANFYKKEEDQAIIDFLVKTRRVPQVGGVSVWKLMEDRRLLPGRTWHSMKERFRKVIVNDLDAYNMTRKTRAEFNTFTKAGPAKRLVKHRKKRKRSSVTSSDSDIDIVDESSDSEEPFVKSKKKQETRQTDCTCCISPSQHKLQEKPNKLSKWRRLYSKHDNLLEKNNTRTEKLRQFRRIVNKPVLASCLRKYVVESGREDTANEKNPLEDCVTSDSAFNETDNTNCPPKQKIPSKKVINSDSESNEGFVTCDSKKSKETVTHAIRKGRMAFDVEALQSDEEPIQDGRMGENFASGSTKMDERKDQQEGSTVQNDENVRATEAAIHAFEDDSPEMRLVLESDVEEKAVHVEKILQLDLSEGLTLLPDGSDIPVLPDNIPVLSDNIPVLLDNKLREEHLDMLGEVGIKVCEEVEAVKAEMQTDVPREQELTSIPSNRVCGKSETAFNPLSNCDRDTRSDAASSDEDLDVKRKVKNTSKLNSSLVTNTQIEISSQINGNNSWETSIKIHEDPMDTCHILEEIHQFTCDDPSLKNANTTLTDLDTGELPNHNASVISRQEESLVPKEDSCPVEKSEDNGTSFHGVVKCEPDLVKSERQKLVKSESSLDCDIEGKERGRKSDNGANLLANSDLHPLAAGNDIHENHVNILTESADVLSAVEKKTRSTNTCEENKENHQECQNCNLELDRLANAGRL